ncbi:MAG: hypothetical protein ACOYM3_19475, partial [Terrimicrobiaceae bacterium]
ENPTKAGCATAFYWLALDAHRRGDAIATKRFSSDLLISNTHTEVTHDKWLFQAKALLLANGLQADRVSGQAVECDRSFLEKALLQIQRNLIALSL